MMLSDIFYCFSLFFANSNLLTTDNKHQLPYLMYAPMLSVDRKSVFHEAYFHKSTDMGCLK